MGDLPKTYKACVYDEPGKISTKIVDLDMPEPGAGEVLINLYVPSSYTPSASSLQLTPSKAPTPASATRI